MVGIDGCQNWKSVLNDQGVVMGWVCLGKVMRSWYGMLAWDAAVAAGQVALQSLSGMLCHRFLLH
jgi:hypothetical protein